MWDPAVSLVRCAPGPFEGFDVLWLPSFLVLALVAFCHVLVMWMSFFFFCWPRGWWYCWGLPCLHLCIALDVQRLNRMCTLCLAQLGAVLDFVCCACSSLPGSDGPFAVSPHR